MAEYAERDILKQGNHYMRHVAAMTTEGLHDKSDIAAELAHRDIEIKRLRNAAEAAANWMDNNGEVVFAGGGWGAVNRMNEAREIIRTALQPNP